MLSSAGGFAGVRAALKLANKRGVEVRLLVSQSYFEYHAALYRSATGRSPLEVAIPLREFFAYADNVTVIEDKIVGLHTDKRQVTGESGVAYPYDALVLALGSVTAYYGIKGLKEHAYGIKSIDEALRFKRHLHDQLLKHETERNFVVIGAGASGIELSAELTAYLRQIRRRHDNTAPFQVQLIEAAPRILPALPEVFSAAITQRLKQLGVRIFTDTAIQSETADAIQLPNGPIQSHTVIWTAGMTNNPFFEDYPEIFQFGKNKRVKVNEFLEAAPSIYVIGDSADTPYSGMAQTALHDADFVAVNLLRASKHRTQRSYQPRRPVYAIPVGPHRAAVLWGRWRINGRLGWLLRRLADLRLYIDFLPFTKALTTWRFGFKQEEVCPICKR